MVALPAGAGAVTMRPKLKSTNVIAIRLTGSGCKVTVETGRHRIEGDGCTYDLEVVASDSTEPVTVNGSASAATITGSGNLRLGSKLASDA